MHDISKRINDAFTREDWQAAINLLEKALARNPEDHWLLDRLSCAHYEAKDYPQALAYIRRAREFAPDCPLVQWDYAGTIFTMGDVQGAYRIYADLIKQGPEKTGKGSHGEGLKWANSLLVDCLFRLGLCFQHLGNKKKAIKVLRTFMFLRAGREGCIYSLDDAAKRITEICNPGQDEIDKEIKGASMLLTAR